LEHPILKNGYVKKIPEDRHYSVEHNLEILIPRIKYVEPLENKNVFVFGTGSGGTVACALNIGKGKVIGIDINEDEINKTKIRAEAYNVRDKIELYCFKETFSLPFKDGIFDVVLICSVIEYIVDERGKYIREAFRILKKNGLLVISGTPNSVLNEKHGFTSAYLKSSDRINSFKRKILFTPYMLLEYFLSKVFKLPIMLVMPYLNHIFIRKS
jgi:ubiquinone/menaquinone biosynthesis C-methylase UbiE